METGDLEQARDAVTRVYLPHELVPDRAGGGSGDRLGMVLNAIEDRNFTLGFLTYGAPTRLSMPATENCYHVNLTIRGRTHADRQDGKRAKTAARSSGVVLLPDQLNRVRWTPDAEQLILKIPRTALECHLGGLLGRPVHEVVDFDFQIDLTTPRGRGLLASVEFLAAELDRPGGLADMPLAREQLEAFVLTQLLSAVGHRWADELHRPVEPARPGRLRAVVEYMESNADDPLTPGELARVGCMSVRTLHASFQQAFGESPMAYLRRIRLDHVRAELTGGRDPDVRITDVAMRWGFFHPSRFAQQYRKRFGELPSATVRRCTG
nr:AraC family transcriptional regulator [Pseudonocardia acidicola]